MERMLDTHAVRTVALAATLLVTLVAGQHSFGYAIIRYDANPDPTTVDGYLTEAGNQLWTLSAAFGPNVGTGVIDGSTPAWSLNSPVAGHEERWFITPTAADISEAYSRGFTLSTRLRLPSTSDSSDFGVGLHFIGNGLAWVLVFGTDADGDPIVQLFDNASNPAFTLEGLGNADYHTYTLLYNPHSDLASLSVDGVGITDDFAGFAVGGSLLMWGDLGTAPGNSNWNIVEWKVPEPASAMLLLTGAAMLIRRRR